MIIFPKRPISTESTPRPPPVQREANDPEGVSVARSAGTVPVSERAEFTASGEGPPPPLRRWRRWVIVAVVLVLLGAGAVAVARGVFADDGGRTASSSCLV